MFTFAKNRKAESESTLAESAKDAILLGHVKELDDVLAAERGSGIFPERLRYGIEALRYFRAYYGKGSELEPTVPLQKQKAVVLESSWGSELLDMMEPAEAADAQEG